MNEGPPQIGNGVQRYQGGGCLMLALLPFIMIWVVVRPVVEWAGRDPGGAMALVIALVLIATAVIVIRKRTTRRIAHWSEEGRHE